MSRSDHDLPDGHPDESIGAATRALADATATLTKMLSRQVSAVMPEVSEAIANSLREASRGLADASENVERKAGSRRADERRKERVDRTRADLLDAAARVFAAHGYEGASVGDIAAEAGYTKGALYAHFGSKSEVFLEIARQTLCSVEHGDIVIPGVSAAGVDRAAVAGWLRSSQEDPRLLLSLEFLSYGIRHPESSAEMAELHARGLEVLAEQIAEVRRARHGGADDEDVSGASPREEDRDIALAVISIANLAVLQGKLTQSPDVSPEAGARAIARLLEP